MAETRKDPARKTKVDAFKASAKERSKKEQTPKEHLIPMTEWETTSELKVRGDLMEALEQNMVLTFQNIQQSQYFINQAMDAFQKTGRITQLILQSNIKDGVVKMRYVWNNGEEATEQEVKEFEDNMKKIMELQKQQQADLLAQKNSQKTGLVGADGSPIGTDQDLEERAVGMANEAAGELDSKLDA